MSAEIQVRASDGGAEEVVWGRGQGKDGGDGKEGDNDEGDIVEGDRKEGSKGRDKGEKGGFSLLVQLCPVERKGDLLRWKNHIAR